MTKLTKREETAKALECEVEDICQTCEEEEVYSEDICIGCLEEIVQEEEDSYDQD